ncbi:MAG: TonB-dependent receptor plug domain-containing protein, partial [Steroidobacteraceae bacterium]
MKERTRIPLAAIVSTGLLGTALASEAFAQQAVTPVQQAPTPAAAQGDQLEKIVVTAQKRESTIETTPISITAISGTDLQDRGITDITSVVQSVPGVSMRTSGPGQTEL